MGKLFLFLTFVFQTHASDPSLDARAIVSRGQELLRGEKSSRARAVMTIERPKFKRTLEVESFHEGTEKSFLYIHRPAKESGTRTLRVKQDVWTWTRKTEQAVKIPFSLMHSSWMGSDFTYEDIVKLDSFVTDYRHEIIFQSPDPQKRKELLLVIQLTPHENAPVVWGKVLWSAAVSRDGKEVIPVSEEDYNERGELIRRITLDEIKPMGGKTLPTRMTCEMLNKEGKRTVLEYRNFEFDVKHKEKLFTLQTLEQGLPKKEKR